jgi:MFS family permease
VFAGPLGRLSLGLFLLEVLAAVQVLVVATVLPTVTRDLGGIRFYGWAFSASALATVMAIPITGQAVDRMGPRRPLVAGLATFVGGTVLVGLAPTMPLFVVGRFLQGLGGGAQYAVGLGTVAKSYPEAHRPRLLALLAAAWALPGLLGPSYGALIASTVGWRWAFLSLLPLVAAAGWLALPGLARLPADEGPRAQLDLRRPLLIAAGSGALLLGLTDASWWSVPLVVVGLVLAGPALRGLVAEGAGGRPLLRIALAAGFLLSLGFFGVDGFVPLMLTRIRGLSLGEASVVVTLATVGWSAGTWWQSRVVTASNRQTLVMAGAGIIAAGAVGVGSGLFGAPLAIPYVAWAAAGLGMGVAYPTVYLITMDAATAGAEAGAVALMLLLDTLGVSAGTGLGGSSVSLAHAAGGSLTTGLTGAFAVALAATLILVVLSRRLAPRGVTG